MKFVIPGANLSSAKEKFAKLVKKAQKLGLSAPSWKEIAVEKRFEIRYDNGVTAWQADPGVQFCTGRVMNFHTMEVEGIEVVKLAGWSFLATLDHEMGAECTIIRKIADVEIPTKFRSTGAVCDHCNRVQRRTQTFVIQHENGTFKQVGSSCLKDFLGHDVSRMLTSASYLAELASSLEMEEGYGSGSGPSSFDLVTYLSWVCMVAREQNGFVTRGAAESRMLQSTADTALMAMEKHYKER